MKRKLVSLTIALALAGSAISQGTQFKLKHHIAPAAMMFAAGIYDGVADGLDHHYDKQDYFWNPDISQNNKYKNRDPKQGRAFPGSLTWLVWTTDGWHLMRAGRNLFTTGAVVFSLNGQKKKWYWYLAEVGAYALINRAGFHIAYSQFKY